MRVRDVEASDTNDAGANHCMARAASRLSMDRSVARNSRRLRLGCSPSPLLHDTEKPTNAAPEAIPRLGPRTSRRRRRRRTEACHHPHRHVRDLRSNGMTGSGLPARMLTAHRRREDAEHHQPYGGRKSVGAEASCEHRRWRCPPSGPPRQQSFGTKRYRHLWARRRRRGHSYPHAR
jgi:hypothetical protein